jgi:antitoxin component YwqK of YwqJK toxin-antitoxin module
MKSYYENGKSKKIENYDSLGVKNGMWSDFYDNGQIKIEQQYTNKNIDLRNSANKNSYGNRIKKFTYFYPNGQIQFSLNYSNDKIDNGLFVEYYSSGQKKISGNLKNGLRDSEWTEYYENGKIKSKGNYSSGSYTICGVVPFTAFYEYKVGEWSYYFANGEIKANGIYDIKTKNIGTNCKGGANLNCGILTKEWTFYKADGNPIYLKDVLENKLIENQEILRKRVYETE